MGAILDTAIQSVNRAILPVYTAQLTLTVVIIVITLPYMMDPMNNIRDDSSRNQQQYDTFGGQTLVYDFIVVGSGSGGGVTAVRLCEIGTWKILLIESGGDPPTVENVPLMFPYPLTPNQYYWNYTAYSSRTCKCQNGFCFTPRLHFLGGCPGGNAMFYIRSTDKDHQKWWPAEWSYANVLKYYLKAENNKNATRVAIDPEHHSDKGKLIVGEFADEPYSSILIDACNEMQIPALDDYNSNYHLGYVVSQATIYGGVRQSVLRDYIFPASQDPTCKMDIMKNSHVTQILINDTLSATGVEMIVNGRIVRAYASKEVILSAGTFNSPQLLMLSGIGPRTHLESLGIPVKVPLERVGKQAEDHFGCISWIKLNPTTTSSVQTLWDAVQYALFKTGPFSGTYSLRFIMFLSSLGNQNKLTYADEEWYNYYLTQASPLLPLFLDILNYTEPYKQNLLDINQYYDVMLVFNTVLNPYSSGTITLKSKDPLDHPNIDMNYLSDKRDLDQIVNGLIYLDKMLNTTAFKSRQAEFIKMNIPRTNAAEYPSAGYFTDYVAVFGNSVWHPSSTCAMGDNSTVSVVDKYLQVYGVKGLRVVDASVMPHVVSGNLNAPTIMIAEKASDLIKAKYLPPPVTPPIIPPITVPGPIPITIPSLF